MDYLGKYGEKCPECGEEERIIAGGTEKETIPTVSVYGGLTEYKEILYQILFCLSCGNRYKEKRSA